MGNFNWLKKEGIKRTRYPIYEIKKIALKSLIANNVYAFSIESKIYFSCKYNNIPKTASISFYKNACFETALSRGIFSLFKYSRHFSKSYASYGFLCGMRKSSF